MERPLERSSPQRKTQLHHERSAVCGIVSAIRPEGLGSVMVPGRKEVFQSARNFFKTSELDVFEDRFQFGTHFTGTVELIQRITAGNKTVAGAVGTIPQCTADPFPVKGNPVQRIGADLRIGKHHSADPHKVRFVMFHSVFRSMGQILLKTGIAGTHYLDPRTQLPDPFDRFQVS